MRGQGRALIGGNVVAWVKDDNISAWLDTLQCRGETTTLEWDLDSAHWTANVEGPGQHDGKRQRKRMELKPTVHLTTRSKLPSPQTAWSEREWYRKCGNVFLLGERDLDLRMHAIASELGMAAVTCPLQVQGHIGAWGHWVSHSSQAIEAKLQEEEEASSCGTSVNLCSAIGWQVPLKDLRWT